MIELIKKRINENIDIKQRVIADEGLLRLLEKAAAGIIGSYNNGGKVFFCGNGGSAADSQHLAAELVFKFYLERKALSAEALTVNTSIMSAVSNDAFFDLVFSKQLEANGKKGDVLLALSTSGKSPNVINAVKTARGMGLLTICFTGRDKSPLDEICDLCLKVPSDDTPRVQEVHILLGHILCELIEDKLFG